MARLSRLHTDLKSHYDAIVIGSGYGGGVAAARLARAGLTVAVFERGREFLTGEFPSKFPDIRNNFQVSRQKLKTGPENAIYDVRLGEDMHVLVGCGLGGGSLINAGVSLRPDPRVFDDPVWPGQLKQDGLIEEGYRRAERWLRPVPHAGADALDKYRAFDSVSDALGVKPVKAPVAVSFEANTNPAGIEQPACTLCGDCMAGCNVGAKNTVAMTYLPFAVSHGAEIYTDSPVTHVAREADGTWVVHATPLEGGKAGSQSIVVRASIVVLSAGTLGSTEILLRSRDKGLALSDRLGERFSANGDIVAFGYGSKLSINAIGVGHPSKIEGAAVGASVSGQIDLTDATTLANELHIQEGVMPSALAPMLPVMFLPNGRLLGAIQSLISGVYKGPFAGLQMFFAVSHDSAAGRLVLSDGRLQLNWPEAKDDPVYGRLDKALAALVERAGGSYVKNPLAGTVMGHQPATAHPLGGCGMGADRSTGVVDHKGRVFDARSQAGASDVWDGLYVVDGSVIPRSLGVNPLLTITALAERAMLHLARDKNLVAEDNRSAT